MKNGSGSGMRRQRPTAVLTDVARGAGARVSRYWGEHLRCSAPRRDERGCTVSCERRRVPGDALIKLEVGAEGLRRRQSVVSKAY
jgi:hypothetical protein